MMAGLTLMLVWCANSWDSLESVSNRMIKKSSFDHYFFFSDAYANVSAAFGAGTGAIHLDNVACTGTEGNVTSCVYDTDTSDCSHTEDAGVTCTVNRELS